MLINILHCDAAEAWATHLQDSASTSYDSIIDLHDAICYWLIMVLGIVLTFTMCLFIVHYNITSYRDTAHGTILELIWTITPALILIAIAVPSFRVLYLTDELLSANISIKVVGHQWYWSYGVDDVINALAYDAYMVSNDMLDVGQIRLLDVDNALVLPIGTIIRLLCTSTDVIHSWAMPSLGIKVDAMPGRLNQTNIVIDRLGTYYGQCSELCGAYHSFMPIRLDAVSPSQYIGWLNNN